MKGCFQKPRRGRIFLYTQMVVIRLRGGIMCIYKVSQFENLPWTMAFSIDYWARHFNEDKAPSKYNRNFLTSYVCWDESSLCEIVHYGYIYIYICTICDTQNMYIIVWICEATVAYMQKMLQGLSWICQMQTWSSSPMICMGNKTSTK